MNNINSEKIQKYSAGIDISSKTVEVRLGCRTGDERFHYTGSKTFRNQAKHFKALAEWVEEQTDGGNLWFVMEATGVYYEELAWYLHQRGHRVCVLVASRAKYYAKSLPIKSKTDAIDARLLARYGLERQPQRWEPASRRLRDIKALLRERQQLKKQRTQLKNRLHATRQAYQRPHSILQRIIDHLDHIERYIESINNELKHLWQSDRKLTEPIRRIANIAGLGCQTVLEVVAETNGFALITNRNQLASYSGLDVVLDESGDRSGVTKISKQGNAHIRRALYMPAICASRHNRALRAFYKRLVKKNPKQKKKALVAVMRKLLLLIYSLWNSGQQYDPEFHYQQITQSV